MQNAVKDNCVAGNLNANPERGGFNASVMRILSQPFESRNFLRAFALSRKIINEFNIVNNVNSPDSGKIFKEMLSCQDFHLWSLLRSFLNSFLPSSYETSLVFFAFRISRTSASSSSAPNFSISIIFNSGFCSRNVFKALPRFDFSLISITYLPISSSLVQRYHIDNGLFEQ